MRTAMRRSHFRRLPPKPQRSRLRPPRRLRLTSPHLRLWPLPPRNPEPKASLRRPGLNWYRVRVLFVEIRDEFPRLGGILGPVEEVEVVRGDHPFLDHGVEIDHAVPVILAEQQ